MASRESNTSGGNVAGGWLMSLQLSSQLPPHISKAAAMRNGVACGRGYVWPGS